jgi:hypothetical protein
MSFKDNVLPIVKQHIQSLFGRREAPESEYVYSDFMHEIDDHTNRTKFVNNFYDYMFSDELIALQKEHGWASVYIRFNDAMPSHKKFSERNLTVSFYFTSKEEGNIRHIEIKFDSNYNGLGADK